MEDVEFSEEKKYRDAFPDPFEQRSQPRLVQWVVNLGLARTSRRANYVLLISALIIAAAALYVAFF